MIGSRQGPLRSDRRGVAAVEFALVSFPFILFIMAVLATAFHFYLQQALDYATQAAARQVQLGKVPANYTAADFVSNIFCPVFGVFQLCGNLFADLRPVTDYQQLANPGVADSPDSISTSGFAFCPGQPGQLMYMHIVYQGPALNLFHSTGGTIIANAAFANENPYGATVVPANGC